MLHQRTRPLPDAESFLHPSHVADLLHVAPNTGTRWATDGRLPHQRTTLGGRRRYPEHTIRQLAASLAHGVQAS
jgi:predicted site-specific integrase-resolvase